MVAGVDVDDAAAQKAKEGVTPMVVDQNEDVLDLDHQGRANVVVVVETDLLVVAADVKARKDCVDGAAAYEQPTRASAPPLHCDAWRRRWVDGAVTGDGGRCGGRGRRKRKKMDYY